jgi:cytochrome P450
VFLSRHCWDAVRLDPSKARSAFEEAIRFGFPVQTMFRTTVGPTNLGAYSLDADCKVAAFRGSATRYTRKWPDPNAYNIARPVTGNHMALGNGAHVCSGQKVARLEAE